MLSVIHNDTIFHYGQAVGFGPALGGMCGGEALTSYFFFLLSIFLIIFSKSLSEIIFC